MKQVMAAFCLWSLPFMANALPLHAGIVGAPWCIAHISIDEPLKLPLKVIA